MHFIKMAVAVMVVLPDPNLISKAVNIRIPIEVLGNDRINVDTKATLPPDDLNEK